MYMKFNIYKVRFLDVLASEGVKAQKTLDEKYGSGKAMFLECDVSKKDELRDAFHEAKSQMGGLNVVCNNAGVNAFNFEGEKTRVDEMLSINLGGIINGSILGLELMGRGYGGNGGVIINTSSITALAPVQPQQPVYSSVKAGVVHFSRCIAQTSPSDHGVRVNCICPDGVLTDMVLASMKAVREGKIEVPKQHAALMQKTEEEVLQMFMKPTDISNEVMKLINDESKNDQVLSIVKNPENPEQVKVKNVPSINFQ